MNREGEIHPGGTVATAETPDARQQDYKPVVLIDELADLLETSVRTLRRQLRAGTFFIPEIPKIDHRHRWSRVVVLECIATRRLGQLNHEPNSTRGPRLVQRKAASEGFRKGGGR